MQNRKLHSFHCSKISKMDWLNSILMALQSRKALRRCISNIQVMTGCCLTHLVTLGILVTVLNTWVQDSIVHCHYESFVSVPSHWPAQHQKWKSKWWVMGLISLQTQKVSSENRFSSNQMFPGAANFIQRLLDRYSIKVLEAKGGLSRPSCRCLWKYVFCACQIS